MVGHQPEEFNVVHGKQTSGALRWTLGFFILLIWGGLCAYIGWLASQTVFTKAVIDELSEVDEVVEDMNDDGQVTLEVKTWYGGGYSFDYLDGWQLTSFRDFRDNPDGDPGRFVALHSEPVSITRTDEIDMQLIPHPVITIRNADQEPVLEQIESGEFVEVSREEYLLSDDAGTLITVESPERDSSFHADQFQVLLIHDLAVVYRGSMGFGEELTAWELFKQTYEKLILF